MEDCEDTGINALHGSDSLESAEREVNFFFPKQQTLAVIKPGAGDEEKGTIYHMGLSHVDSHQNMNSFKLMTIDTSLLKASVNIFE